MPLSPEIACKSTRWLGWARRSFIIGMRLCPPASTLPSSPCLCSNAIASPTEAGRWYSKRPGITGRPPLLGRSGGLVTLPTSFRPGAGRAEAESRGGRRFCTNDRQPSTNSGHRPSKGASEAEPRAKLRDLAAAHRHGMLGEPLEKEHRLIVLALHRFGEAQIDDVAAMDANEQRPVEARFQPRQRDG